MPIQVNDLLKSGERDAYKVIVKYKDDLNANMLPEEDDNIELDFKVTYVQADTRAREVDHILKTCMRATELHEEECNNGNNTDLCKSLGYTETGSKHTTTITYGNLGTTGRLTVGDAFDCDVNDDQVYDTKNERFYYITDLKENSNYAVLIASQNIGNIVHRYGNVADGGVDGPYRALQYLPTVDEWSAVSLYSNSRTILNEYKEPYYNEGNDTIRNPFVYTDKAARLLNVDDIESIYPNAYVDLQNTRPDKSLADYTFFFEATKFALSTSIFEGYWLENLTTNIGQYNAPCPVIMNVRRTKLNYDQAYTNNKYGYRPVIEVKHTDIKY